MFVMLWCVVLCCDLLMLYLCYAMVCHDMIRYVVEWCVVSCYAKICC